MSNITLTPTAYHVSAVT